MILADQLDRLDPIENEYYFDSKTFCLQYNIILLS